MPGSEHIFVKGKLDKYGDHPDIGARGVGLPGYGGGLANEFHDPNGFAFREYFQPHVFVNDLVNSSAGRDYANVEDMARATGVDAVRAGEESNIESARQSAANQGLGRGFANQQETNIRQSGTNAASAMVLGARQEEVSRRYQQAVALTGAMLESNRFYVNRYWQKELSKEGGGVLEQITGLLGAGASIAGSALGIGQSVSGIAGLFGGAGGGGEQSGQQQQGQQSQQSGGGGLFGGLFGG